LVDNGQSFNERDEISTRQAQGEREPGAVHCARLRGPMAGHQSRKELFRRKRLRGGGSALGSQGAGNVPLAMGAIPGHRVTITRLEGLGAFCAA
jgi:hypothetical protein